MPGYSRTPLSKKLGLKTGSVVYVAAEPENYRALLEPLPDRVQFVTRLTKTVDIAHLFVVSRARLKRSLTSLRARIRRDATIWISWPKKASGVASDLGEDAIREIALPLGLVDIKVCAVDDVWSGLKLVIRRELR